MFRQTCLAIAWLLCLAAAPTLASEAEDAFNQLYGDEMKRVAATPTAADDIALAKQLLENAKQIGKQPELLAVIYEKAYELASKDASGYPTTTAALALLAEKVPERKVECLQKSAALCQKQFAAARADAKVKAGEALIAALGKAADAQAAAGDADGAGASLRQALVVATAVKSEAKAALQARLDGLAPAQKAEKQIAALKARLDAKPDDDVSRKELVRLLLVEEDNPAEAAKFLDESLDEATRKYVPAAAKPLEEAPELACKELGEWYRGLADQAKAPASKATMLHRAQGYYERFLELHKTEDLARGTATLMLKKVEDAMTKVPAVKSAASAWTDCLKNLDLARAEARGKWELKNGVLATAPDKGAWSLIALPIAPKGNYEFQATFVLRGGHSGIYFLIPVGECRCKVELCRYGQYADLNTGGGRAGNILTEGVEHAVVIRVFVSKDEVHLLVDQDEKPLIRWTGPQSKLPGERGKPSVAYLGLGSGETEEDQTAIEYHRVRVRALPDDARPPAEAPPSKSKG